MISVWIASPSSATRSCCSTKAVRDALSFVLARLRFLLHRRRARRSLRENQERRCVMIRKTVQVLGHEFDCLPGHVTIAGKGIGANLRVATQRAVATMLADPRRGHEGDHQ